ncbi:MAG: enoyl-CoA hydratase-related protein [Gammaproteobacteria bacterium]
MNGVNLSTSTGVSTITLDRPDVHNAFDDTLIAELTDVLRRIDADDATRVVVLTGAGKSFSSGADLGWMQRMAGYDAGANRADALKLAELMRTLDTLSKPTIARVNGAAFGGAVGLVACCDIAVSLDLAKYSLSEVRLGLVPAVIAPYVVRAIGAREARRWFLTADAFDAATAQRIGLVHEVVTVAGLDHTVSRQVELLLRGGPTALASAKRLVARLSPTVDEALMVETAELIAALRVSPEGQEGLTAFLEKRSVHWIDV